MKTTGLVLAALVTLTLAACGDGSEADSDAIGGNPGIRGTVTDFTAGAEEGTATILVEGEIEADTSFDRASIRVDGDTEIVGADGEELSVDDLEEGRAVEAWFEGPVAESYPVQAYAAEVVILD